MIAILFLGAVQNASATEMISSDQPLLEKLSLADLVDLDIGVGETKCCAEEAVKDPIPCPAEVKAMLCSQASIDVSANDEFSSQGLRLVIQSEYSVDLRPPIS